MTKHSGPVGAAAAFEHDSTLVLALELSGKGWEVGAVLPGVARRPPRSQPASQTVAGTTSSTNASALRAQVGSPCTRW